MAEPITPIHANVRDLEQSPTLAIQALCDELRARGERVFRLGLGQSPFPVPDEVVESLRHHAARKDYLPVMGLPALREAIAGYHRRRNDLPSTPDDVLVGPGSKELMFLLQVVFDGELVLPTPAWVSYAPQATIVGRTIRRVRTRREHAYRLEPSALAELARTDPDRPRVVLLNYPSNPTGVTYSASQLRALAEVAREHRILVLSDEIYGELHFRGEHVSIARFYPEGTIVSSGLSKWCGAGGWRLGTFTFPASLAPLRRAMAAVASETYTSTSAPIQCAAVHAFEGSLHIERYLRNARRILAAIARACARRLVAAGADVLPADGGFYLFPRFAARRDELVRRGISSGTELARRLLAETGVALLPGASFGSEDEELTLRVAFVDFDGARALARAEAIPADAELGEPFACEHARPTIEAIDRLVGWLG